MSVHTPGVDESHRVRIPTLPVEADVPDADAIRVEQFVVRRQVWVSAPESADRNNYVPVCQRS